MYCNVNMNAPLDFCILVSLYEELLNLTLKMLVLRTSLELTEELCEVIENFGLVDFTTLDIRDKESVGNLVKLIDKTNGYIFAGIEGSVTELSKITVRPTD
ncbi:GPN-loop GTPase qqt1 [Dionaea muscipula]